MKISAILFFSALLMSLASRASLPVSNPVPDYLKVENFIRYSPSEFEEASGTKLGLIQKMYFKKLQRKLSRSHFDGNSTIIDHYNVQKEKFRFDPLWFILGCIIGPFAVLFSYTVQNKSKSKHLSAMLGMVIFVIWFGWMAVF